MNGRKRRRIEEEQEEEDEEKDEEGRMPRIEDLVEEDGGNFVVVVESRFREVLIIILVDVESLAVFVASSASDAKLIVDADAKLVVDDAFVVRMSDWFWECRWNGRLK